ncbi:glycine cleavage system protein H [candidate division MSBL1 archaeon SCGC-AAA833F18]|uniref:Probable glycine cleavage system H protein n=1 Tax=candidate division MSBL1 archaeon SCGC-AAA833F18 TaxID=1698257 RepID=A0A133VSB6_9EURY|nr:glycine cleavage system protein H [candidate division MSBL1 archaeon SCGC-AAA833F18]
MVAEDYEIPEGLYYSEEHEWVKVEDNLARVGITDYAQDQLGDVVYADLPEPGDKVKQTTEEKSEEMELGAVESIKAVSSVYSPLSGEVKEVNDDLEDQPELVNTDPYTGGWICVIDPEDLDSELENLMDAKAYADFLESEE